MPVAKSPGLAMLKMRALLHLFCVAFAAGPIGAEDGKNILSGVATRRNAMQLDVEGSSTAVELASVSPEVILQDVATTDSGNLAEMKVTGVRDDSNPNSVVDIFYGVPYGQASVWQAPRLPRREQYLKTPTSPAFDASRPVPGCETGSTSTYVTVTSPSGAKILERVPKPPDVRAESKWCLTMGIWRPVLAESGSNIDADEPRPPVDGTEATTELLASTRKKLLPVVVFFTGSCFAGSDGTIGTDFVRNLARVDRPAIYVSMMHRAGQLGYAGSAGLEREGSPNIANWALLDGRFGLQWIQKHISAFGGDPDRVILYGQSSGGCMASSYFVNPGSFSTTENKKPLYRGLMADSGGFNGWCTVPMDVAENAFAKLYQNGLKLENVTKDPCETGISVADEGGGTGIKTCMRDWLLQHSEYDIARFYEHEISACFTGCASTLVVDGIELKRSMPETLARGTPGVDFAKGVPVLHGTTLDDGVGFMGTNSTYLKTETDFFVYAYFAFGKQALRFQSTSSSEDSEENAWEDFKANLKIRYDPNSNAYLRHPRSGMHPTLPWSGSNEGVTDWFVAADRMYTEWEYTCPTSFASQQLSKKGVPIWEFMHLHPLARNDTFVPHGSELDYLFLNLESRAGFASSPSPPETTGSTIPSGFKPTDADRALQHHMSTFWGNFIYFGSPESLVVEWPKYHTKNPFSFGFGLAEQDFGANMVLDIDDRCTNVWNVHYEKWFTCLPASYDWSKVTSSDPDTSALPVVEGEMNSREAKSWTLLSSEEEKEESIYG